MRKIVVYLAGPDVFMSDAADVGRRKIEACARYGLTALFPLDAKPLKARTPRARAMAISKANERLIRRADWVFANLTPFRAPSADAGTVFEIGFARALGKRVYGYTATTDLFATRTRKAHAPGARAKRDRSGHAIEDFGLTDNLMIDGAIAASGGIIVPHKAEDLSAFTAFEILLKKVAGRLR